MKCALYNMRHPLYSMDDKNTDIKIYFENGNLDNVYIYIIYRVYMHSFQANIQFGMPGVRGEKIFMGLMI